MWPLVGCHALADDASCTFQSSTDWTWLYIQDKVLSLTDHHGIENQPHEMSFRLLLRTAILEMTFTGRY